MSNMVAGFCEKCALSEQFALDQTSCLIWRVLSAVSPAKEIQLMHRAPVIGIVVLDGQSTPLPEPLEVAHDLSKSPNMQGSHQLLVVSEEQLKVTQ